MLDNKIEEKWPLTEVENTTVKGHFLFIHLWFISISQHSSAPGRHRPDQEDFLFFRLRRKKLTAADLIGKNNQSHRLAQQDYYITKPLL